MSSTIQRAVNKDLVSPPSWLPNNTIYEVIMGSVAYGVSSDTSDMDVYGVCIPPKDSIFPHLRGEIEGFGRQKQKFEQWQQHHVEDDEAGKEYDFSVYSIVKFFNLAMENNPNIIDSLFVPQNCILYSNRIGGMIRDGRRLFLHKGSWHKFKGYAYSQLHKISSKNPVGKRLDLVQKYGFDCKFAYHVVRLLDEVEQILTVGDIDLQRDHERLKAIRRGEWTELQVREWFARQEILLNDVYAASTLRHTPDETAIKNLLLSCLEEHYGSLSAVVYKQSDSDEKLAKIREIVG